MKIKYFLIALCALLCLILFIALAGGCSKVDTIVLTQDGRYIGIKTEERIRFPWQASTSYREIQMTSEGFMTEFPDGTFSIYHGVILK